MMIKSNDISITRAEVEAVYEEYAKYLAEIDDARGALTFPEYANFYHAIPKDIAHRFWGSLEDREYPDNTKDIG